MDNLGHTIRGIRKQLGLTQEDFASTLGVTVSTINRWEQGHARPSKLARRTLTRVAGGRGIFVPSAISDPDASSATVDTPWFPRTSDPGTGDREPMCVP